jgi:hypothetical protein
MIYLMKGGTVDGSGAGSPYLINIMVSKLFSASNGSLPVKN